MTDDERSILNTLATQLGLSQGGEADQVPDPAGEGKRLQQVQFGQPPAQGLRGSRQAQRVTRGEVPSCGS